MPAGTPVKSPVIYPNPWDGDGGKPLRLHLFLSEAGEVKIKLFTSAFRKVWQEDFSNEPAGNDDLTLNLPGLANGIYYLVVFTTSSHQTVKLLVLQ